MTDQTPPTSDRPRSALDQAVEQVPDLAHALGELRCLVRQLAPLMNKKPEWSGVDVGCMAMMSLVSRLTDDSLLPVADPIHAEACGCATQSSLLYHLLKQSYSLAESAAARSIETVDLPGTGQYL